MCVCVRAEEMHTERKRKAECAFRKIPSGASLARRDEA